MELNRNSMVELLKYQIWFINVHFKGKFSLTSTNIVNTVNIISLKGH